MIDNNNIFDFFLATSSVSGIQIGANNDAWIDFEQSDLPDGPACLHRGRLPLLGHRHREHRLLHCQREPRSASARQTARARRQISGSSNEFRGLDLSSVSTAVPTSVQGNIISGINQTTSRASTTSSLSGFIGMALGATQGLFTVGNVTGNEIGSQDGSSTIVIAATSTTVNTAPAIGIFDFSFTNSVISNNRIGSITINSGGTGTR